MAKLKEIFDFAVKEGMKEDPRSIEDIKRLLKSRKKCFRKMEAKYKKYFDKDSLINPYDDSKILVDTNKDIKTVIVGIDVETPELLLVDRLKKDNNINIDLVIVHHPEGKGLALLHEVMDINIETANQSGLPISQAEATIRPRIDEVKRGVHPINIPRTIQAAKLLDIPLVSMHTITDNHVHTFWKKLMEKEKPRTLKDVVDLAMDIPEYQWASEYQNGPQIFVGDTKNKVGKYAFDFTGGTEPGKDRIEKMAHAGISTIIGMHMSRDQVEECKKHNINVVIVGHMSSDSLGINLLLDKIEKKFKLKILEFSGFKRFKRK